MKTYTKNDSNKSDKEVKIIMFSGEEGATGNMITYECGDDIIILDVGISFPDDTLPGIDLVIPDFSYILEHHEKVRGMIITHAHEDHLGAVPYLLKELDIPIYSSKVVHAFLKDRIADKASEEILAHTSMHLLDSSTGTVQLGQNFKISAFDVNHSVPNALGISIETPQGKIIHMADFKIDYRPLLDKPFNLETLTNFGKENILCLLSDCLGADSMGHSESERSMDETFINLFRDADDRQIMVTQISSNIARLHQIFTAAMKVGRKIVIGGRSLDNAVRIGRELGYLDFPDDLFVSEKEAINYLEKDLVYVVAGCFGQLGSTADRISRGEHKYIRIEENCRFIVSAAPHPPGSRIPMEAMSDRLILAGAEVVYPKIYEHLHVGGHGKRGDLETAASAVKPKYFIPIGGTVTHMRAYRNMVRDLGFNEDTVFELLQGESVIFDENGSHRGDTIPVKQILVDGKRVGEIGAAVIKDRETLSTEGVFVVVIPVSKADKTVLGGVEVITRGFIYVKESKALMGSAKDIANKVIDKYKGDMTNWPEVQRKIEKEVEKFLYKKTGNRPMIIVHSLTV